MPRALTLHEVFWRDVLQGVPKACWPWKGRRDKDGYGILRWQGRLYRANRVSFALHMRPLEEGEHALHECNNPPCCNYFHLYPGDQDRNMTDAKKAGRSSRGSARPLAKLTEETVAERHALATTHSQATLAAMYGVTPAVINNLLRGRAWQHVETAPQPTEHYAKTGEGHHFANLTAEQVLEIRQLALTHSLSQLAAMYSLDKETVASAIRGRTWKHVPGALPTFDMHAAHAQGSNQHMAALTEAQVSAIRQLAATGHHSQRAIARQYGVSFQTVNLIVLRKTWKHVL